jgi:kynurenine formamidase
MGTHDATGSWARFHEREPGLSYETIEWIHERSIAAVATDTSRVEAPSPLEGLMIPFHMLAIRDMGLHLGEFWYLEELARNCDGDGVYEFFLSAQGLPITGAVGSPTNPIAIK